MKWNELSMADRAKYIALGVKNGVTSLDNIKEAYNSYAEGGYKGNSEDNPIELDEVVVTPAPWQIDFHKNFGDKEIRNAVLQQAEFNAQIPSFNNEFLDETSYPYYQTKYINRLYNVWINAGKPKIYRRGEEPWYIPNMSRANYHIPTNSIILGEDSSPDMIYKDIIAELSHPVQSRQGEKTGIKQFFRDLIPNIKNVLFDDLSVYGDKESMEYETHSIIQPELEDYVRKGINTKYIK